MVVQCEQCRTRFKLDDSKVGDKGVKVRCSKCKHVFLVRPERTTAPDEPDFDAIFTGLGASPASLRSEEPVNASEDRGVSEPVPARVEGIDGQTVSPLGFPAESGEELSETTAGSSTFPFSADEYTAPSLEDSKASFNDNVSESGTSEIAVDGAADSDFSLFDIPGLPDSTAQMGVDASIPATINGDARAVSSSVSIDEEQIPPELHDVQGDSALSAGDESAGVPSNQAERPPTADVPIMAALPGEESAAGGSPLSDVSPAVAISVDQGDSVASKSPVDTNLAADEPPPLAIASRRKSSSLLPLVAAVVSVVVIVVLAVFGFYWMNQGPAAINNLGIASFSRLMGLNDAQEEGRIVIRTSKSEFMRNNDVGEIFVIRGEAVNEYKKPRASIQVKATVFGPKGEQVSTRTVYCGNLITPDQLVGLPMAKLESAMNNQFGDSLANLGVQPGKAIPFVIVIPGVPKEASEFGLEVAGSTVANR